MNLTPQQIQLQADIKEWEQLKEWMAKAKDREAYLRKSIAERSLGHKLTPAGYFPAGTNRDNISFGDVTRGVCVKSKLNYIVLEELITPTVAKAQLTPEEHKALIKVSYDLSMTGYKALPAEKQTIVNEMLLIKPGSIELEIK